ncbi:MAG: tail fiber protein [Pirellulaceae bacterium]
MAEPFLGQIQAFGFNFAPQGWATCNGQLLSIAQNTALFALLGTTYGGNGQTTFALPDLRGRSAIHMGQGPGLSNWSIGQSGGAESATLTVGNLPTHNHPFSVSCNNGAGGNDNPQNNFPSVSNEDVYATTQNAQMGPMTTGNNGSSQPFSILDPRLTVNFCIALFGIFPPRS